MCNLGYQSAINQKGILLVSLALHQKPQEKQTKKTKLTNKEPILGMVSKYLNPILSYSETHEGKNSPSTEDLNRWMLIPVLPTTLASDDVQGSADSLILQPITVIAQKASQLNIYFKNSLFIETVLPFSLTAESRLLREDGRKLSFIERTRNSFMLWFLICFQLMTLSNNNTVSKPLLKAVRIYSNPISSESIFHKSFSPEKSYSQYSVTYITLEYLKDQEATGFIAN